MVSFRFGSGMDPPTDPRDELPPYLLYIGLEPSTKPPSSFADSIRKFFRMSTTPVPALPPPPSLDIFGVLGVESNQRTKYDPPSLRSTLLAVDAPAHARMVMNDLLITSPTPYKTDSGPEHEFMGFTAVMHNVVVGFLEIHRNTAYDATPVPKDERRALFGGRKGRKARPPTTMLEGSASLTDAVKAADTVRIATASDIAQRSLGDPLTCSAADPNTRRLYHLYAAMTVIHDYAPLYSILRYQCYWYTAAVRFLVTSDKKTEFRNALMVTKPTGTVAGRVIGRTKHAGKRNKVIPLIGPDTVDQVVNDLSGLYKAKVREIELMLEQKIRTAELAQQTKDANALANRERVAREAAEAQARAATEQIRAANEQARAANEQTRAANEQARAANEQARAAAEAVKLLTEAAAKREAEWEARIAALEAKVGTNHE